MVRERTCAVCGARFRSEHYKLYCGPECAKAVQAEQKRKKTVMAHIDGRICAYCGKRFFPVHLSRKTCSDECQRQMILDRKGKPGQHNRIGSLIPCQICGRMFATSTPNAKYCSKACRREADRRQYVEMRQAMEKAASMRREPVSLEAIVREAEKRGLSYGRYVYLMEGGGLL